LNPWDAVKGVEIDTSTLCQFNVRRKKMFKVVPFSEWSNAARKLERKWDESIPAEIKKRGYVRFFQTVEGGEFMFCLITNKSASKVYGCGWAKRFHSDFDDDYIGQKVAFNRAVDDLLSYE
jgi:hypothetical protein